MRICAETTAKALDYAAVAILREPVSAGQVVLLSGPRRGEDQGRMIAQAGD